jgi:5' nucleotidase, deoxy (Pyrimidine), cytosolic type C protein (NT5C)
MRDKGEVGADLYVEDSPENIRALRACNKEVIILSNPTNVELAPGPGGRADGWLAAEEMIRRRYYDWLDGHDLARPPGGWPRAGLGNGRPVTYCIVAGQLRLGVLSPKTSSCIGARYWGIKMPAAPDPRERM